MKVQDRLCRDETGRIAVRDSALFFNLHARETARPELQDVFLARREAELPVDYFLTVEADRALGDLSGRLGVAGDEAGLLQCGTDLQPERIGADEGLQRKIR